MNGVEPTAGSGDALAGTMVRRRGLMARLRESVADRRDPVFLDLSASGELLVARVRVLLLSILLAIQLIPGNRDGTRGVTLPLTIVALVVAILFYFVASRRPRAWMEGFASSAVDVTLVSCGLAAFLLLDQPHIAVSSRTLFEVYFLAIGCASLRYNAQACAFTGLLAVGEYGALVVYAAARWNLNDARYAPFKDGMFDWNVQGVRLILLGAAALVSALVVLRAQGLRLLSGTDRLTGVANRRAFDERLAEETTRARRYRRPFAIALIDIDDFKSVNDSHGHARGDAVLRTVARILDRSMRQTDLIARLGGDEFALLLPETTAELLRDRLEHLRHEVATTAFGSGREPTRGPLRVTLSIGVATWPDDGAEPHVVMASADARLYEAKRRGRNRIVGPPPACPPGVTSPP